MFNRLKALVGCSAVVAATGCGSPVDGSVAEETELSLNSTSPYTLSSTSAREWMTLVMKRVQADGLNPPRASRIYAYAALSAYEAIVPEMNRHVSLGGVLNEMPAMPHVARGRLDVETAQAAALGGVTNDLFAGVPESQAQFSALADAQVANRRRAGVSAGVIADSVAFGQSVATLIIQWSHADAFATTRDLPFTPPVGPEFWVPTGGAPTTQLPAEPYWGTLRPFALPNSEACAPPPPISYSEDPSSQFYAQPASVYATARALTEEQKAIALFWADNAGSTATPPGHWIAIVTQLGATHSLAETVEAYALTGIALADAFISCWRAKFTYNLLRPETYIRRLIDGNFQPFLPTPQFPEYTSGHSTCSGSASTVLTQVFGNVGFVDDTHFTHGLPSRTFDSFEQAAEEAALSRLYGGIHYPMGNENGLAQGHCIGTEVLSRARTRK